MTSFAHPETGDRVPAALRARSDGHPKPDFTGPLPSG